MSRLFTFGCSFTKYHYPTWADIVGTSFIEYQNWGRGSAGNNFILTSLQECHTRNKLTSDDTVIVLFAPMSRTDYYRFNTWAHEVNTVHELHSDDIFSCPYGLTVINYAWISSIISLLSLIKVNYKLFSWSPFIKNNVYELYKTYLNQVVHTKFKNKSLYPCAVTISEEIKRFYKNNAGENWPSLQNIINNNFFIDNPQTAKEINLFRQEIIPILPVESKYDNHPSPIAHLNWVKQHLPEYEIKEEIINLVYEIDSKIINKTYYEFVSNEPIRF